MADRPERGGQRDGRPPAGDRPAAKPVPSAADPDIEILPEAASVPPRADGGPDPNHVRKLVRSRVERIDRRRAKAGKGRSGASNRNYKRTASAEAQYVARGRSLLARYKRELGLAAMSDEDVDPREFVQWLFSLKPSLKLASWRVYRLAASSWVRALPNVYSPEASAMLEGDVGTRAYETRPAESQERDHAKRGVATRIGKAHVDAVLAALPMFSRSEMVVPLRDWIGAGLTTGLQPSEWATAILEPQNHTQQPRRRSWLHVVNPRSAHPTYRIIDVSNFSDEAFGAVERMVKRATEWSLGHVFDLRRSQCTQLLAAAHAALFPHRQQRCLLETLHHQFVHNAKVKYPRAEVAALVGYLGNDAVVNPGKRRLAWAESEIVDMPVPMPAAVTQMRKRIERYEEREQVSRMRDAAKARRQQRRAAAAPVSGADDDSDLPE